MPILIYGSSMKDISISTNIFVNDGENNFSI